jgi:predicted alpha/beta superfamily hydrolase
MDSKLKSGNEIRRIYQSYENKQFSENCITIGVRHFGNYRTKRRRDFIPPHIDKNENSNFARCDVFYEFLSDSILPELLLKYRFTLEESIFCGHSFGGVFGLYMLLDEKSLFDKYVILSPSTWVNQKSIFEYENHLAMNPHNLENTVHITLGGLEIFNKVYFNTKKFIKVITARTYDNLELTCKTYNLSTHNSYLKRGLKESLDTLFPN